MRWLILIIIAVSLISGCSPEIEKNKTEPVPEKIISRDEASSSLPCFKCHPFKKFTSPEKGVFSHITHRDAGYHCNQCHKLKAHSFIKTDTDLCNDCHKLKTFSYTASGFPAKFNHESHSKQGCKECHPSIFQMKKGADKITMDSIYHGRHCGACHDGKKAFPSSECALCHEVDAFKKSIPYRVEGVGDVSFSHEFHTRISTCDKCHPVLFEMKRTQKKMTMEAMNAGKYCGACHNGSIATTVTECEKCHKG